MANALPHSRWPSAGKTAYFPCSCWLSRDIAKDGGQPERTLLGSPINPRHLAELEVEAKRLAEALEAAQAKHAALQVAADSAAAELRVREAALAAANKLLSDTKQENSLLHEQSESLAAKLTRAEAAAVAAEAELGRARAELASARAAENAVAAECSRLQHALEGRHAEAAGAEATAHALREELASKSGELGRLRAEAGVLRRQLDDLTSEAEEAKAALAALRAERESAAWRGGGVMAELEVSVARLTAELEAAQGRLAALQQTKEEAERRAEEGVRREAELASKLLAAQEKAAAAATAASPSPAPVNTAPLQDKAQLEEAGPSAPASPARTQVQYTARVWVRDVTGTLQPDSLCLTLLGSGGSTGLQCLDISAAGGEVQPAGGTAQVVACSFSAPDVGRMERARLGLVAGGGAGAAGTPATSAARPCAVLLSRLSVRCEASGESATFWCTPEAWLSSGDDFDFEYDAATHTHGKAHVSTEEWARNVASDACVCCPCHVAPSPHHATNAQTHLPRAMNVVTGWRSRPVTCCGQAQGATCTSRCWVGGVGGVRRGGRAGEWLGGCSYQHR